jgi:hypothetical protein
MAGLASEHGRDGDWAFARRTLMVIILVALAYAVWQAASLAPLGRSGALTLFSIVAFGLLFGLPGVALAAPGTVAVLVIVIVKKLWVRQTLGEPTKVPGEDVGGEPVV